VGTGCNWLWTWGVTSESRHCGRVDGGKWGPERDKSAGNTIVVDGIVGSQALSDPLKNVIELISRTAPWRGKAELRDSMHPTLPSVDIPSTPAEGTISVELTDMAEKADAAKPEVLEPRVRGEPRVETRSARSNRGGHGRLEERHSWTLLERSYNRLRAVLPRPVPVSGFPKHPSPIVGRIDVSGAKPSGRIRIPTLSNAVRLCNILRSPYTTALLLPR
jgi:hypothetical protein